jgi:type I restriction enzyme S subunit
MAMTLILQKIKSKAMRDIQQLIKDMSPEGVEYFKLEEVFEIRNGYTPSKKKLSYWTNGNIPWFRMDDIRKNGRILNDSLQHVTKEAIKRNGLFPANSIVMSTTATIGEHALLTADSLANQQFTFLSRKVNRLDSVDPKFAFYYCFKIAEWCKENMAGFKKIPFPIPPLPVQEAIVTYLDKFSELETELETELEAELVRRQKQYEWYRTHLLDFRKQEQNEDGTPTGVISDYEYQDEYQPRPAIEKVREIVDRMCPNGVEYRKLGEIIQTHSYKNSQIKLKGNKDIQDVRKRNLIPIVSQSSSEQFDGFIFHPSPLEYKDTPVIVYGDHTNSVKYIQENFVVGGDGVQIISATEAANLDIRYMFHQVRETASALEGGYKRHFGLLKESLVAAPPLEVQKEIVKILDQFDTLVNDIQSGIPAEIDARRKQYAYYREQMFSFDHKQDSTKEDSEKQLANGLTTQQPGKENNE